MGQESFPHPRDEESEAQGADVAEPGLEPGSPDSFFYETDGDSLPLTEPQISACAVIQASQATEVSVRTATLQMRKPRLGEVERHDSCLPKYKDLITKNPAGDRYYRP